MSKSLQMRSRMLPYLFCLFASASLAACGGDGPGDATGSTCPSTQTLTYDNFGKQFFQANCLRCHASSGPESPKFDTVEQIRANASDIDRSAAAGPSAVNSYMPDGASVDEAERRKLGEWLACGAP